MIHLPRSPIFRGLSESLSKEGNATNAPRDPVARGWAIADLDPEYIGRAWIAIAVFAAIVWPWSQRIGLSFVGYAGIGAVLAALLTIGCIYGFTGRDRTLADLAHYIALWIAFPVTVNIYSYVIATLRRPLRDPELAWMDAALGFHWLAWLAAIEAHRWLTIALKLAYNSIFLQVFASVVYFALAGRRDRNRELLWMAMLSALITVTISGFLPAYGPFIGGSMPAWSAVLEAIRGGVSHFKIAEMEGIVAFPSFHTILGILIIYTHRPPARTFVPAVILNAMMLIAIPFAGHHYLVDMIGGTAVAALAIVTVQSIIRTAAVKRTNDSPAEVIEKVAEAGRWRD